MENKQFPFLTAYGPKPRVQLQCNDSSRAKQSFQKECDINQIMAKYQKTGLLSHVNTHAGNYDDLPNDVDYHENMNAIKAADAAFASLTSSIRAKFFNDPGQFLEFVHDPNNAEEMIKMGLAKRLPGDPENDNKPPPDPDPVGPEDKSSSAEATAPA